MHIFFSGAELEALKSYLRLMNRGKHLKVSGRIDNKLSSTLKEQVTIACKKTYKQIFENGFCYII